MTCPTRHSLAVEQLEARVTPVSFGSPYGYAIGGNTRTVAVGDINNDGKLDFVASDVSAGTVPFINNGSGTFTQMPAVPISDPRSTALVDMDGDGKRDIVVAAGMALVMVIARGKGDGLFESPFNRPVGGGPQSAVVADFNADGKPDVAVASNSLVVMMNDGSANILGGPTLYNTATDAYNVAAGDFNGDGKADIALSGYSTNRVDVLLNNGSGFSLAVPYPLPAHGGAIAAGDLNHDGRDDLMVTTTGGALNVMLAIPSGTFQAPVGYFPSVGSPGQMGLADFDGDGNLDVAADCGDVTRVAVFLGNGTGGLLPAVMALGSISSPGIAVGDVTGDGKPDLVTTAATSPGGVIITPNTTSSVASFTVTSVANAVAGQGFDVTVTARDAANAVLTGFTGAVSFTSNDPLATAGNGLPANYTFGAGDNGVHTFTNVVLKTAGARTITAQAVSTPTATGTTNVTVAAAAASSVVVTAGSGQMATVNMPFVVGLGVRVADAFGNPVPNVPVTFTGPASGAGATFPGGATVNTDAGGNAVATATAEPLAGAFSVVASVPGLVATATFNLNTFAGAATKLTIVSGNNQEAYVTVPFGSPLVVLATDDFGNIKPGLTITLTGPASGAGATFPSGASQNAGADGTASIPVRANAVAGTYTVQATGNGIPMPVTFMLTNSPPLPLPTYPELTGTKEFGVGSGAGQEAVVRFFRQDRSEVFRANAFPGFTGGVRTAAGDFNGDGVADLVVGTGAGAPTLVRILNGTDGTELFRTAPFEAAFPGGVYVAAGDLTGDGKPELVITPDEGGGPRVTIIRGGDFTRIANFFGIDDANFRGGVRAAVGDFNGDRIGDLVVAAGFGGGPRVAVFNGATVTATPTRLFNDFFVFEEALRNGAFVAAGDLDGDGRADLIGGGGPGGGPRVLAFNGLDLLNGRADQSRTLANLFAGNPDNRGGVRVAVKNLDNDAKADLVVGDGEKAGSRVTAYLGVALSAGSTAEAFGFDAFAGFNGGVFVG